MVSLSYGYAAGFLNDCGDTSQTYGGFTEDWSDAAHEHEDGNTATLTVDNGDYYKINVSGSTGNKSVYYEYPDSGGANNLAISSTLYSKIRFRYKTSDSSVKAMIILVFSDASKQTVLAESSSTTWTVATADITSAMTIDHIRIYATQAAGDVYYDFIKIYKGDFTLPNTGAGMELDPAPRDAVIDIFGRDTDIIQRGGTKSAVVNLSCDLDLGGKVDSTNYSQTDWQRPQGEDTKTDSIDAEVFLDILHNRNEEPWQWLDTGSHQFKVTVYPKCRWVNNGGGSTSRLLDLVLTEYSLGSKDDESYAERFGIGL